jgi:hypothetical protein
MTLRADKIMIEMAATFRQRNKMYGDNWKVVGTVMKALFPNGMKLETENDFVKLHLIDWMVGKLTRLTFSKLTHVDSVHDLAVYAAMLETIIRNEHGPKGSGVKRLSRRNQKPARRKAKAGSAAHHNDRRRTAKVNRRSDKAPRGKRRSHRHSAPVRRSRKT